MLIQEAIQFHQTPELKEKAKALGLAQLEYDGCSDIYVKNWDDWVQFYNSPDYAKALARECSSFEYFLLMLTESS